MALHDEILLGIHAGQIPYRFRTRDLKCAPASTPGRYRIGGGEYATATINAVPRNHSIRPDGTDPGDYVRKGRQPAFFWSGNGEYELVLDRNHTIELPDAADEEFGLDEGNGESLLRPQDSRRTDGRLLIAISSDWVRHLAADSSDAAQIIVDYIATQPFQAHYRRKPVESPQHGWGARLQAYFWPTLECGWAATCARVQGIASQIQSALAELQADGEDAAASESLLNAFKSACVWGGVKLPESDSRRLASEFLRACRALADGQKPTSDCRLNSAWTKLYALALPDTCVIYDSRVATALTSTLSPAMDILSRSPAWQPYEALGTIPGIGGSRPRALSWKWPVAYGRWDGQLAANLLCQTIVDNLNRQSPSRVECRKNDESGPWTLREVEAVLFMEGY